MNIPIRILNPGLAGNLPAYETEHAAGMDLRAAIEAPLSIIPGEAVLIPCGFSMAVPPGYAAILVPRSGLGHKKGLVLGNLVGVIDADYRGEVMVSAWNRERGNGTHIVTIHPWDRIAQMLIIPVERAEWDTVDSLPETTRGAGGFGSTG